MDKFFRHNVRIPKFVGDSDFSVYEQWETKVEQILFSYDLFDAMDIVKITALEFEDYALYWWNQLQKDIDRGRKPPVRNWTELKNAMKKRFMPSTYRKELLLQHQRFWQGSKSVEEYYKEMELLILKIRKEEDEEAKMTRFLFGLNQEIQEVVELHEHNTLEELLHQASKVERRIKRRASYQRYSSSSTREKKEEEKTYPGKSSNHSSSKDKYSSSSSKNNKSSSSKVHTTPSSPPKPKIEEKNK